MLGMAGDCDSLSRSQVLDVFEDINKSGSMFISLSEFQLMLSKINIHLSKVIVMDLFAFIDINNDSLLSVEVMLLHPQLFIIKLQIVRTSDSS